MPYVIILIVGLAGGLYGGKKIYQTPITAGQCVDAGTKSLGEKINEAIEIIKS